mmetsp:Transcript_49667/g.97875  ORF Transcript_49667/g.97875 Transcript_49667/m.97875 type:complete len:355 (-) Transcript_49667:228-1292(-)
MVRQSQDTCEVVPLLRLLLFRKVPDDVAACIVKLTEHIEEEGCGVECEGFVIEKELGEEAEILTPSPSKEPINLPHGQRSLRPSASPSTPDGDRVSVDLIPGGVAHAAPLHVVLQLNGEPKKGETELAEINHVPIAELFREGREIPGGQLVFADEDSLHGLQFGYLLVLCKRRSVHAFVPRFVCVISGLPPSLSVLFWVWFRLLAWLWYRVLWVEGILVRIIREHLVELEPVIQSSVHLRNVKVIVEVGWALCLVLWQIGTHSGVHDLGTPQGVLGTASMACGGREVHQHIGVHRPGSRKSGSLLLFRHLRMVPLLGSTFAGRSLSFGCSCLAAGMGFSVLPHLSPGPCRGRLR